MNNYSPFPPPPPPLSSSSSVNYYPNDATLSLATSLAEECNQLRHEIISQAKQIQEQSTYITDLEETCRELGDEVDLKNEVVEKLTKEIELLHKSVEENEKQRIKQLSSMNKSHNEEIETFITEIVTLDKENSNLASQLSSLEEVLNEKESTIIDLQIKLREFEKLYPLEEKEDDSSPLLGDGTERSGLILDDGDDDGYNSEKVPNRKLFSLLPSSDSRIVQASRQRQSSSPSLLTDEPEPKQEDQSPTEQSSSSSTPPSLQPHPAFTKPSGNSKTAPGKAEKTKQKSSLTSLTNLMKKKFSESEEEEEEVSPEQLTIRKRNLSTGNKSNSGYSSYLRSRNNQSNTLLASPGSSNNYIGPIDTYYSSTTSGKSVSFAPESSLSSSVLKEESNSTTKESAWKNERKHQNIFQKVELQSQGKGKSYFDWESGESSPERPPKASSNKVNNVNREETKSSTEI
jgi:hypothetical protein